MLPRWSAVESVIYPRCQVVSSSVSMSCNPGVSQGACSSLYFRPGVNLVEERQYILMLPMNMSVTQPGVEGHVALV